MKRQKYSSELRRTSEKIKHCIVNSSPDATDRMLSAVSTQAGIAFDIEALEAQPSKAGKNRTGYRSPLRRAVEQICMQLSRPNMESVLQVLEDGESIEDMYEAAPTPIIDIHAIEVFRDDEKVKFTMRTSREKTVTFKTIRNLIDMHKASLPD